MSQRSFKGPAKVRILKCWPSVKLFSVLSLYVFLLATAHGKEHPACVDFVATSCKELKLSEKHKNPYFKHSAYDPQNFASRSFQKITFEYAFKNKLLAPINKLNSLGQKELSPILAEALDNIDQLFKNGNKRRAAELVAQLYLQPSPFIENDLTYNVIMYVFQRFWRFTLMGMDEIGDREESRFFALFKRDNNFTFDIANGIKPFCEIFAHAHCRRVVKKLVAAMYLAMWREAEVSLESNLEYKRAVHNAIWTEQEKSRLSEILQRIKKIAKGVHGTTTPQEQERLDAVHLEFPLESTAAGFKEWLTGENGYDNRGTNNIEIFGYYAKAPEAELVSLLAHEYGHQLIYVLGGNTLQEKYRTLKDGESLHYDIKDHLHSQYADLGRCLMTPESAGINFYQLNEELAVWYEVELMAKYMSVYLTDKSQSHQQRFSYFFNMSCDATTPFSGKLSTAGNQSHPDWNQRSNRTLMAHPFFRALFSCSMPESPMHCPLNADQNSVHP